MFALHTQNANLGRLRYYATPFYILRVIVTTQKDDSSFLSDLKVFSVVVDEAETLFFIIM